MVLAELKKFIIERRQVSLDEISRHFHADPELVESMLDGWMMKGRVVRKVSERMSPSCCGSCGGKRHFWYEWVS
ncbi:MAG: hypothetical protein HGB35_01645 [Geobacteraceae bacterium]|nr:hypothetical protein [Geobacteraceae bacterium]